MILREIPNTGEVKAHILVKELELDKKTLIKHCKELQKEGYLKVRKPLFVDYRISKTGKLPEKPGNCKIISVSNHKGGVGKTTTSINISSCLAKLDKKVLLVDLDPQANASSLLGHTEEVKCNTYDILSLTAPIEESIVTTDFDFDFVPSEVNLVGMEVELMGLKGRENRLNDVLTPLREKYDFIIIDCPPSLSLLTINALTAADSVLIPVQSDQFAVESLTTFMKVIELVRDRLNPGLHIDGAILTMHEPNSEFSNKIMAEVKNYLKETVFDIMIDRDIKVSEASAQGKPIIDLYPDAQASTAYMKIADKLI